MWFFDTVTTPLWLLCNGKVTCMIAYWRFFFLTVVNGYAGVSDQPRELLKHTGKKPGKSWSWVDTSLSLVPRRDEYVRYGMVRLDEWWVYLLMEILLVMLIFRRILGPPESAVGRVLFSNPPTCFVLPLVPAAGRVRFSKLSTPYQGTHRTERPWWKIPDASGRHATWSGGMGVSGWDREGGTP